jgi:hypothetical protein
VQQWAELRREQFVAGKSIRELSRTTGLSRNTIRRALRADQPPGYRRSPQTGALDPFMADIHRWLKDEPKLTGVRIRELFEPLGCTAGKTIVDDYLREVRPLFAPAPRSYQWTVYREGGACADRSPDESGLVGGFALAWVHGLRVPSRCSRRERGVRTMFLICRCSSAVYSPGLASFLGVSCPSN